jgi:hypothetical protein
MNPPIVRLVNTPKTHNTSNRITPILSTVYSSDRHRC